MLGQRHSRSLWWAAVLMAAAFGLSLVWVGQVAAQEPQPPEERPRPETAERLFQRDCAHCHGPDGDGTSRGPSLEESGTAGVKFMLSTGRMPISDQDQVPLKRQEPAYTAEQIEALTDYTEAFTSGPPVPDPNVDHLLVAEGGKQFRASCAACHQMVGTGGVLVGNKQAPNLHESTAEEVVAAIRFGPGTMPAYSEDQITEEQANAIASYIELVIQRPRDEGGIAIGHFGPWSEGFVAWFGGIGSLLFAAGWIGKRT